MKKWLLSTLLVCSATFSMEDPASAAEQKSVTFSDAYFDGRLELFVIDAQENNHRCGTVTFKYNPGNKTIGHIYTLEVDEAHRHKKIGYRLFARAVQTLKKQGYSKISWLGWNDDEKSMPRETLKTIYRAIAHRLSHEIPCHLTISPWEIDPQEYFFMLTLG